LAHHFINVHYLADLNNCSRHQNSERTSDTEHFAVYPCTCSGEKAFCSAICRDQEIQLEEEAENNTASISPRSSCSSIHEDIFMAGMTVTT